MSLKCEAHPLQGLVFTRQQPAMQSNEPQALQPELAPIKNLTRKEMDELTTMLAPIIEQRLEKKLHLEVDKMVQEALKKHHEENEATLKALKEHVDDIEERVPTECDRIFWTLC